MLKLQDESGFAFVKVAQNSLKSGISAAALGCLAVLELSKSNPNHTFTMKYIRNILKPYKHSDAALSEIEKKGYLTKHCYSAKEKNVWSWVIEVDSFHQDVGSYGIVYHSASGVAVTGANKRMVHPVCESLNFVRCPKTLILDKEISLSAKGLFIHMIDLSYENPNLPNKSTIQFAVNMGAYDFKKAWKELVDAGYLLIKKCQDRKYDFYLVPEPLPAENMGNANGGDKKRQFFKINTKSEISAHTQKSPRGSKTSLYRKKESCDYNSYQHTTYDFENLEFSIWLGDYDTNEIKEWEENYGSKWEVYAREKFKHYKEALNKPRYDFAMLQAMVG